MNARPRWRRGQRRRLRTHRRLQPSMNSLPRRRRGGAPTTGGGGITYPRRTRPLTEARHGAQAPMDPTAQPSMNSPPRRRRDSARLCRHVLLRGPSMNSPARWRRGLPSRRPGAAPVELPSVNSPPRQRRGTRARQAVSSNQRTLDELAPSTEASAAGAVGRRPWDELAASTEARQRPFFGGDLQRT
jgi:hypothetical protein